MENIKKRILLVEDDPLLIEMQKTLLLHLGYDVIATSNGFDALDLLKENFKRFSLIITDQTMPHMTGIELCSELIKLSYKIPIILMTGFSQTLSKEEISDYGISKYIEKPIKMRDLKQIIDEVLS